MKKHWLSLIVTICCVGVLVTAAVAQADDAPCTPTRLFPIKSGKLYKDYYGSMVTTDKTILNGARWGITNPKPQSMAYFGGTMRANGPTQRFHTTIYIDDGIKAAMVFQFKDQDRNGTVLKTVTVEPGESVKVDFETGGSRKVFVQSELRINHDTAKRIVIGEPEFYSCTMK